jgi:3-methyl-2-oxobutanoate hydroxymethyltransferase
MYSDRPDAPAVPVTVPALFDAKRDGRRLTMLTCYDAGFARAVDAAGVDMVLVGA